MKRLIVALMLVAFAVFGCDWSWITPTPQPTPKWKCQDGVCVQDNVNGTFTTIEACSQACIPNPIVKPSPPFPQSFIGPIPTDKSQLIGFCDAYAAGKPWAAWLKAHPEDLDWAWGEFLKVYYPTAPKPKK